MKPLNCTVTTRTTTLHGELHGGNGAVHTDREVIQLLEAKLAADDSVEVAWNGTSATIRAADILGIAVGHRRVWW